MLTLFPFQREAVNRVQQFHRTFYSYEKKFRTAGFPISRIGSTSWDELNINSRSYSELITETGINVPNCSITIPTGGGKTLTGLVAAVELLESQNNSKSFIVWLVPTDAIYQQVVSSFSAGGLYFKSLLESYGKKINLKTSLDFWSDSDIDNQSEITVLLLSKDAVVRDKHKKSSLIIYKNTDLVSGLSVLEDNISPSLFELIKCIKPVFVIDEAHKIYTEIGQQYFQENVLSSFLLELTATPKQYNESHKPNIIFQASGADLVRHGLIKKSIKYNSIIGQNTKDLIADVIGLQNILSQKFSNLKVNIVPRVLLSVEYTGKKMASKKNSISEIRSLLIDLGVSEEEIIEKSSEKNELANRELDDPSDPTKFILTKTALVEGWDCKSVYIIVLLNNIGARLTNVQIIGRGLRQPRQKYFEDEALNTLYLITNSSKHDQSIRELQHYLFENGLGDLNLSSLRKSLSNESQISLIGDPIVRYIDFDKNIYNSSTVKRGCEDFIAANFERLKNSLSTQDIEHIQAEISSSTGKASAPEYKVMTRELKNRSGNSIEKKRLEKKLYMAMRNYFLNSRTCFLVVQKLLNDSETLNKAPSDELIIENLVAILSDLKKEYHDTQFSNLLNKNSKIISGKLSEIFNSSFKISSSEESYISFNNCLLEKVPTDFLNNTELEFARFLEQNELFWLKTTPSFKIDFPYPMGTFYPDFVVVSNKDGGDTTMYIETKGDHLVQSDDSISKRFACEEINSFADEKINMVFGNFEECRQKVKAAISI